MENTIFSVVDQQEIARKIFADRVRSLHENLLLLSIPGTIICTTAAYLGLYQTESPFLLVSWYLTALFICVLRVFLLKWYEVDTERPSLHLKLFTASTTLSGVIWGVAGTLLMSNADILHKVLIIIIIAGVNAGGCQTLRASKTTNSLFMLTSILPLALWLVSQQQSAYAYLSVAIFAYLVFMLVLAQKLYVQFVKSYQLQYENEMLVNRLTSKQIQLRKVNKKLHDKNIENEKSKNQLKYLVSHDLLTGLENRLSFDTKFEKLLARSKKTDREFSVIYIDVDHFKQINDNYGHDIGDLLLIEVANRLKQAVREQDTLVRIGGDEFIVLMGDSNVKSMVDAFSKRIYKAFAVPFQLKENAILSTISMGGSVFPEDGDNRDVLLKKADIALYRSKALGRNRYAYYEDHLETAE